MEFGGRLCPLSKFKRNYVQEEGSMIRRRCNRTEKANDEKEIPDDDEEGGSESDVVPFSEFMSPTP